MKLRDALGLKKNKRKPKPKPAPAADAVPPTAAPRKHYPGNTPRPNPEKLRKTTTTRAPRAERYNAVQPVRRAEALATQRIFDTLSTDVVLSALELSGDPRADRLVERLRDPELTRSSNGQPVYFAKLCRDAGIMPRDVWHLVIESYKADGNMRLAVRLPEIMEQLAADALPSTKPCGICAGTGAMQLKDQPEPVPCRACGATGALLVPVDNDVRKLALEAIGVLTKAPLINQQFNQQNNSLTVSVPDMSDWSRSTDAIFEERPALPAAATEADEAEVVE